MVTELDETMRNMSFSLTKEQIRQRTKTVTRRLGWLNLKTGEVIRAVEKCQGLKKGEKVKPLGVISVVSKRREPLKTLIASFNYTYGVAECRKEGFPEMTPLQFVGMFCRTHKGCCPETEVTRIEFEHIEEK